MSVKPIKMMQIWLNQQNYHQESTLKPFVAHFAQPVHMYAPISTVLAVILQVMTSIILNDPLY